MTDSECLKITQPKNPSLTDIFAWYDVHHLPFGYHEQPPSKPGSKRLRRSLKRSEKRAAKAARSVKSGH